MKPITLEQKNQFARMGPDVLNSALEIALDQLETDGEISLDGLQRVLGKGRQLKSKAIGFLKEAIRELAQEVKPFTKLISGGKQIAIGATDGTETLANAGDVFKGWVDPDFKNWDLDVPSDPTKETKVQVHEMVQDGTFAQIFNGFGTDLNDLCFSQAQIKKFCKEHADWLRTEGYGTFFLFKKGEQFFVAYVYVSSDGLDVHVRRLDYGAYVWDAEYALRVVVPQLPL